MASFPASFSTICMLCVYFLSFVHAAFIIDANGTREVNITQILQAARRAQPAAQQTPSCVRGDAIVRLGTEWQERCRECTCTETGTQCTGPQCAIPYESIQEVTCAKFADECCCGSVGCLLEDGTTVPVGGAMPFDPANPCNSCTCWGGNRTNCLIQSCFPFECVDAVRREGQCCPDCPNGRTCVLPFNLRRQLPCSELRAMEPVHEFSPVTLMTGTPYELSCSCQGNLVAKCTKNSPLHPVFGERRLNIVA
ncbi:cysteine-rich motor neuron 1 protein-like [Littorina saxatilis]|uniref:VWFC domain-containing protein n=1 Tax=Littorina saxatilis TaxID=31220 RepID=A0AAN9G2B2_9CAEN